MRQPLKLALSLGLASFLVTIISTAISLYFSASLFSLPPGTEVRPMLEAAEAAGTAGAGTIIGLGLGAAYLVIGRKRVAAWVVGLICMVLALAPLPVSLYFFNWVMRTHGLISKP